MFFVFFWGLGFWFFLVFGVLGLGVVGLVWGFRGLGVLDSGFRFLGPLLIYLDWLQIFFTIKVRNKKLPQNLKDLKPMQEKTYCVTGLWQIKTKIL